MALSKKDFEKAKRLEAERNEFKKCLRDVTYFRKECNTRYMGLCKNRVFLKKGASCEIVVDKVILDFLIKYYEEKIINIEKELAEFISE